MPYTTTPWIATATPLSAANLNNLETQILEAKRKMSPPVVRWTSPGWYWISVGTQAVTANRIYYMPIYVAETTTYIRIGINVTIGDGAGGLCDLRIFNFAGGIPTTEVLSAGTVNTNGAGLKEIVIAQALAPGYYFLASRFDQTPTCQNPDGPANRSITVPTSGLSLTGNMNNQLIIMYDDAAYADPAGAVDGTLPFTHAFVTLREN